MKRTPLLVAVALLLSLSGVWGATTLEQLRSHVAFLASPELEGRLTGTPGESAAAAYIVEQLKRIGAKSLPGLDGYRSSFEFTAGMSDAGSTLALEPAEQGQPADWRGTDRVQALSFSDDGSISGSVVFAGYGLSLPEDEEFSYNSFVGLDVKDKIVLVLRYFPEDVDQERRSQLARYSGLRYKAMRARELGATAILIVTGPRSPNAGETIPMNFDTALSGSGILAASISGDVAATIFSQAGDRSLEKIQAELDTGNPHLPGFELPGLTLTLSTSVTREKREAASVVGLLPATVSAAPGGSNAEYVLLGAHMDHLGQGKHGDSLARKDEQEQVHHGADDNASGVAALLAAGARLAGLPRRRPILLAFWSGEELGLLGSTEFINSGIVPTESLWAYVNLDMVGRMRDNRLSLQAVGSSSVWPRLIEQTNVVVGFDIGTQEDPYLPTDATSFYTAGVPTINLSTGSHEDYHRPTDRTESINYEDLERVARFTALFADKLGALSERPDYLTVVRNRSATGSRGTLRAFTGTIPDYTTEVQGVRLSGVIEGGPADLAGLLEGDVIVEFAGREITNVYDYSYALEAVKIDVTVKVVVLRDGVRHEVEITPGTRD